MAKVKETRKGWFEFECAGCGSMHFINTNPEYGGVWNFNRDLEKPSAQPSLSVRTPSPDGQAICHFYVTDGNQQFLSDCTHENAGKTLEIPEIQ